MDREINLDDQLVLIASRGKQFNAPSMVLCQLNRLSQLTDYNHTLAPHLHEDMKLLGIVSRPQAIKDTADVIASLITDNDCRNLKKYQATFNALVNGYYSRSNLYLSYGVNQKYFYSKLSLKKALKLVAGLRTDIKHN